MIRGCISYGHGYLQFDKKSDMVEQISDYYYIGSVDKLITNDLPIQLMIIFS